NRATRILLSLAPGSLRELTLGREPLGREPLGKKGLRALASASNGPIWWCVRCGPIPPPAVVDVKKSAGDGCARMIFVQSSICPSASSDRGSDRRVTDGYEMLNLHRYASSPQT